MSDKNLEFPLVPRRSLGTSKGRLCLPFLASGVLASGVLASEVLASSDFTFIYTGLLISHCIHQAGVILCQLAGAALEADL
jgi:hypothetical protein